MSTAKDDYKTLIDTIRKLGLALSPALAAQYEAPPRSRHSTGSAESGGVRNPTLDTVLDPRRLALSDEIRATATTLRKARNVLEPHIAALNAAVTRWEGQEGNE
ncbi:hypothetical protein JOF56_003699 [Kibdelosporangium banguiense]|uniref:Uncharacterized protein n=1 Tax=Kibdelosporangium banguiense TaxID=1365924 RepID=A0ABS4TG18_9PSEU|nr:hypothetical protein [Kibdelosporangium banguiense]MBP2323314.1 hypothetical protein [Kibdelosporangium banguiense]